MLLLSSKNDANSKDAFFRHDPVVLVSQRTFSGVELVAGRRETAAGEKIKQFLVGEGAAERPDLLIDPVGEMPVVRDVGPIPSPAYATRHRPLYRSTAPARRRGNRSRSDPDLLHRPVRVRSQYILYMCPVEQEGVRR